LRWHIRALRWHMFRPALRAKRNDVRAGPPIDDAS
jgi:hypothetical protein